MNVHANNLKKIANQIKQYVKRIINHDQMNFIPECKVRKSMLFVVSTNKQKDHFGRCRKAFDKILYPFLVKISNKLKIEGYCLNLVKGIYEKQPILL